MADRVYAVPVLPCGKFAGAYRTEDGRRALFNMQTAHVASMGARLVPNGQNLQRLTAQRPWQMGLGPHRVHRLHHSAVHNVHSS